MNKQTLLVLFLAVGTFQQANLPFHRFLDNTGSKVQTILGRTMTADSLLDRMYVISDLDSRVQVWDTKNL
jgi:hypothetical protein